MTEVDKNLVIEYLPTLLLTLGRLTGHFMRLWIQAVGQHLGTNITPNYSLLLCSWRLKLCSCWVSGASGCGDGTEMTQL